MVRHSTPYSVLSWDANLDTAFQIIWAKISDVLGRKWSIIAAVFIFTAFSGACGGSQSVIQLYVHCPVVFRPILAYMVLLSEFNSAGYKA